MEGHTSVIVNTVTAAIIVAFLAWASIELNSMGKNMAAVQTTLQNIREVPKVVIKLSERISIINERLRQLEDNRFQRYPQDP